MDSQLPSTPPSSKPSNTAWWISDYPVVTEGGQKERSGNRIISFNLAIAMAVIAGVIGSIIGHSSISLNSKTNLVSTANVVERAPNSIAGIAARVSPSVVSISVKTQTGGDTGSGFFIQSNGYILTNNHVVSSVASSGASIQVILSNGKSYDAKLVGRDAAYDLAVIKIDVTDAPALQLGNSDDIQVGDGVIAIGSPLGLAGTVTSGIISAKNRAVTSGGGTGESSFINALQTDAAINPGNSGGPLVNLAGAVIGVNSSIASLGSSFGGQSGSIGLGFAIPINQAQKTASQLIKTGTSTYPIMGLSLDSSYRGVGALVANQQGGVLAGGPAERAGIKPGDVITAIDGKAINSSDEAIVAVRSHNVGDRIKVSFTRGTASHEISLVLIAAKR